MSLEKETLDKYTIDGDLFKVLVNDEGQYSIWPSGQNTPEGWKEAGCSGSKDECSEFVDKNWTDMRPISLQRQMKDS
jgi:MbtH protein